MPDCDYLKGCIFFNDKMGDMPSTSSVFKMMYCNDNFLGCARFMVRTELGMEQVPDDLFPNQVDRAKAILAGTSSS